MIHSYVTPWEAAPGLTAGRGLKRYAHLMILEEEAEGSARPHGWARIETLSLSPVSDQDAEAAPGLTAGRGLKHCRSPRSATRTPRQRPPSRLGED